MCKAECDFVGMALCSKFHCTRHYAAPAKAVAACLGLMLSICETQVIINGHCMPDGPDKLYMQKSSKQHTIWLQSLHRTMGLGNPLDCAVGHSAVALDTACTPGSFLPVGTAASRRRACPGQLIACTYAILRSQAPVKEYSPGDLKMAEDLVRLG